MQDQNSGGREMHTQKRKLPTCGEGISQRSKSEQMGESRMSNHYNIPVFLRGVHEV